jgi:hypothetical protein
MRNLIIGLLVVAALVVGGGIIAQTAYQAGVSTAVTTAAANGQDGTVVTPVAPYPYPYYGPGWGWGWHGGWGIFGFLFFLFFLFLIFGLLRAVFWRGRGWGGPGGYGGPGRWAGPGGPGYGKWGDHDHRARFQEAFDDMHRQSHEGPSGQSGTPAASDAPGGSGSAGPTGSTSPNDPSA